MAEEITFKSVERKVYSRTFLSGVIVVLSYTMGREAALLDLQNFLKENFGLLDTLPSDALEKGISVDDRDKSYSFFFSKEHVGIKYMKSDYVSFTVTMMPYVYRLLVFLKTVANVQEISKIQIRKVNTWYVAKDKAEDVDVMIKDFLSNELRQSSKGDTDTPDLKSVQVFSGFSGGCSFGIRYGIHDETTPDGDEFRGLILEEDLFREKVCISEIETVLVEMNSLLYNIFHWCVSASTIAYMNQEK